MPKIYQRYAKYTPMICHRYANIPTFQQSKFVDEFLIFPKKRDTLVPKLPKFAGSLVSANF